MLKTQLKEDNNFISIPLLRSKSKSQSFSSEKKDKGNVQQQLKSILF